jgi:predicted acyltransferase (DUF342 family)
MRALTCCCLALMTGPVLAGAPQTGHINDPICVDANQQVGTVWTINGDIKIGDKASVGEVRTVNGDVLLGASATAASLATVNGKIAVGTASHIFGDTTSVNGAMDLEKSSEVSGRLSSINGNIRLVAAHVGRGIQTVSGDIEVGSDSRVEGGLLVKRRKSSWVWSEDPQPSVIVVGPGASISGPLRFEHPVRLYVSDRATLGPIEGAKPIIYSGERPAR